MHINHRRRNKFRSKHHGVVKPYFYSYSLKCWKILESRARRAEAKDLIRNGRFDELPQRYYRDLLWYLW